MKYLIDDFTYHLENEYKKKLTKNSINSYISDITGYIDYLENILKIESINLVTEDIIKKYLLKIKKNNVAITTLSRKISSIKIFHDYLLLDGYVQTNESINIKKPRIEKQHDKSILSIKEVDLFLNSIDTTNEIGLRNKAMIEIMYSTGIKVSELLDLKLINLDLTNNQIIIKKNENKRILPIGYESRDSLSKYLTVSRPGICPDETPYLFINRYGNKLSRQGFNKILKNEAKKIGLDNISPQILRDSFALHLINNGIDLTHLRDLLGNKTHNSTLLYNEILTQRKK